VNVPKANIWQELRGECLDAIGPNCRAVTSHPVTLSSWREIGYYKVLATSKTRVQLLAPFADVGSALLTDAECCLDNAAEHQVSLWRHIHSEEWLSPAWLAVTFYYWSFYLALAMTRMTGKTAWFLTKDVVRDFAKLAPTPSANPGGGCFRLQCGQQTSATDRELSLDKSDTRIHDEIWQIWLKGCTSRVERLASTTGDPLEERLFTALATSAKHLGNDWPSAFRNAVNYRAGFAYTAVRKERVLKSLGYLKKPYSYAIIDVIDRFENNVVSTRTPAAIHKSPQTVLELLVDFTFILHAVTTELHRELIERHRLDGRWRASRQRFLRSNGAHCADGLWPL
jgi:hypothetical protein